MKPAAILRIWFAVLLATVVLAAPSRLAAQAKKPAEQNLGEAQRQQSPQQDQAEPEKRSLGGELAEESREAAGEEEENVNLKHGSAVRWIAKELHIEVHTAHLLAIGLNFVIIAALIYWAVQKSVPHLMRRRTESIQRALEEARAASKEANRRLVEIEARLRKLDVEIGQLQATAEKESESEEARIKQATEHDIRKVVESAGQEIAAAAKQARRELTAHTADLAVALARQQIHVDSDTDQALVRNFAGKLSSDNGRKDGR